MTTLPANLLLFRNRDRRPGAARPQAAATRRLLERGELIDRLEAMGDVAPHAPLSFLLVHLCARRPDTRAGLDEAVERAGRVVLQFTRPIDAAGRWTCTSIGIALQGTGATAAAATAARLSYHLNQLLGSRLPGIEARVYAATGTGLHACVLPTAALDSVDEAG